MNPHEAAGHSRLTRSVPLVAMAFTVFLVLVLAVFALAASALAGQASTGELAFYPCDRCHPVVLGPDGKPTKPLPVGLDKHEITLEKHDILGQGDKACLACHDVPTRNPGMLILPDGSLVEVNGDTSRTCQRCHFEKYQQFKAGVHGKKQPKCTAAGCHDAHTPSWIYIAALPPFQGTGLEVKAVGADREPFKPLASPPLPPPVVTPLWFAILASIGVVMCIGIVGSLFLGRSKR